MRTINYNMRCIEIGKVELNFCIVFLINYNMRCIEILVSPAFVFFCSSINYNMRCIEIAEKKQQIDWKEG